METNTHSRTQGNPSPNPPPRKPDFIGLFALVITFIYYYLRVKDGHNPEIIEVFLCLLAAYHFLRMISEQVMDILGVEKKHLPPSNLNVYLALVATMYAFTTEFSHFLV